jgi:thiosulfate dehydrogenase [quinone] large subunit
MAMTVIQHHRYEDIANVAPTLEPRTTPDDVAPEHAEQAAADRGPWFARALATLRIAFGITFLWAFLDKAFALGFHTGYDQEGNLDRFGDAAWINGGSPTEGFLMFGVPEGNPFKGFFNGMADSVFIEWLFMAGLLGIGLTLLLGIGMRIGTAAGAAMYAFMYAAALPLENNPVVDEHLIGIIVMAVLALGAAGTTWGLQNRWNRTDLVTKLPVLR